MCRRNNSLNAASPPPTAADTSAKSAKLAVVARGMTVCLDGLATAAERVIKQVSRRESGKGWLHTLPRTTCAACQIQFSGRNYSVMELKGNAIVSDVATREAEIKTPAMRMFSHCGQAWPPPQRQTFSALLLPGAQLANLRDGLARK